ncbi:MAG: twin-arginine translocase TatA/TatE family subunit [Paenibacillaceae bacterium]|uniref:twin-arginine translocase TatA/TatE family subunit n=1 Tax=Paenibacillus cymbidii TaxID=1639034 RepID=UPI0010819ACD|nr:twin-arginine translocase TatA/TatE family subunit [Paenibacillus cymbidii]MBO9607869.1 twin-arginine translocase TatA/TatE family subunit [Paenibacillaceae bacterium]
MLLGSIGPATLVILVIAALLLFGPTKLPELGRAFGKTLREFKKGTNEILGDNDEDDRPQARKEVKEVHDIEATPAAEKKPAESRRLPD